MSKNVISIFLSALFLVFVSAPTVIMMVDDSVDVSIFYTSSEEEEKGQEKNNKDKELLLYDLSKLVSDIDTNEIENNLVYFFKKYPKPYLNLISPPPELYIF